MRFLMLVAVAVAGFARAEIEVHSVVTNGVEVRWFEEMVPMKDGTRLYTYGALPPAGETRGIVFIRNPYVEEKPVDMPTYALSQCKALARGYAYVEQHVRGTGMSDGAWVPYENEREDGLAMLEWLRRLPHYGGEIFLSGRSYLSSVHFSYLSTNPPDVKGAVLFIQDVNRYNITYRNGFFKIGLHGDWFVKGYRKKDKSLCRNGGVTFADFPLADFSRRYWGEDVPALDNVLRHPRPDDPFWCSQEPGSGVDYLDAISKSTMPILLRTGFYDIYTDGVCEMWRGMSPERRSNCALVIDAYDHGGRMAQWAKGTRGEFPGGSRADSGVSELDWFDFCRTGRMVDRAKPGTTRYYALWENKWKVESELADGTRKVHLALGEGARSWTYDPRHPLPKFPGSGGICFGSMKLQPPPGFRDDVVSFVLPPVDEQLDVRGRMTAELAVSSDCEDTCFYVRVSVRKDDGKWYLLRDDITALSFALGKYAPGEERRISFCFADHAFRLEKGDALRVDVSSANSQFAPHPNVAGDAFACSIPKVAHNTVIPERSFLELPAVAAVGGELPRVWTSNGGMKDSAVFEKAVEDCRAHGIDVMNNGAAPNVKLCTERLSICRAHGMKLHVGVPDSCKADKLAKDTGRYELAVMSGGCYKGLAIDRNLFSFTAAKHEIIVEPPVYSKGQAYAKHPHYYMLGDGHYFGGYVPTGRAEVVVPERPFDGKQHLRIVPAKVEIAPPDALPENDSAANILDTREIKERRLVKLSFDLTGCDGCMLDKVGLAVYWHMDANDPKWKPERTCYSVFSPITREHMRKNVRGALAPWIEANGGKFPDDVVVGLRIGDEIFNATGWLNCPAASFPLWDYSDSAIAAFRAASPEGVEHPRTWGAPEVYGPDACAQFLYLFHKACAEYVRAAVEEAHKASPQIVAFRNTTRGDAWAYANDHDGTGQELLVAALDAVNLDPYPVGRRGYANDSIPFDMAYLSGLTRRHGKLLLPWMQAHEFPACGLVHPKPDDIERMWRQMKPFAPDAIMWLGYNAVGKNMMTFPNGNPASWEKAKEVHAELKSMPKPVRRRPPLAIVRPYSARAIVCETKNGFVNPADVVLSQFAKAWSCDLGREYDVFEVPPYESEEAKEKRSAELGQYAQVVSSVDWPGAVNVAHGYEDKTLTHKDLKRLREEFRQRYEKTSGLPEKKARPVPDKNLLERMRSGVDVIGIVHFGLNTFTDREWGYGSESPDDFNPTDFDADQIVKACRDGGIKGLVIVAKHHDGFCLWPTKTTEHNITKSPFGRWGTGEQGTGNWERGTGRDYVGEMEKACRKFGVKFGVYCSPWDRNNAAYATPEYVKAFHAQVEELNDGRYGEIFEMWFDGANGGDGYYGGAWEKRSIGVARKYYRMPELWARVRELQPKVCFFGGDKGFTWPGNERGEVPPESGGTRDDGTFRIYEADFPLRPGWFYHESQDGYSRSGEFLMKIYLRTVGNGATMDIGIAPDRRGRLSDEDVGCLRRFAEIREEFFSKPVADASSPFNVIVMTEDIEHGERVDEWRIVLDGRELAKGGKIGTKRIRVLDAPVSGKELRLEVVKGDAKADEIKIELFAADKELVRKVMASEEPKRPPAPFELKGVLTSRKNDELVYMMKHPRTVSSIVLSPDAEALDGAPVVFRLAYSVDGSKWTEDATEYRLDNVAANPVPQKVALAKSVKVKYLRLRPVRTLKDGAAVHLPGLEFVPAESGGHRIVARDSWYGFNRKVFEFQGQEAWIVEPKKEAEGRPWAWIMEWPDAFAKRTGSVALLKAGYHVVTLRPGHYANGKFVSRPGNMNNKRLGESRAFQKYLVDELHFAPKANLIGMSWGGFYSVRYAGTYPDAVTRIYLDAPLLDFSTAANKESWGLNEKYGIDVKTYVGRDDPRQPVNMYDPIAKAGIPILLLYGGADATVPPSENCMRFAEAFKSAGGDITIVARKYYGHHPHGLEIDEQQKFVDFFNGK